MQLHPIMCYITPQSSKWMIKGHVLNVLNLLNKGSDPPLQCKMISGTQGEELIEVHVETVTTIPEHAIMNFNVQ